MKQRKQNAGKKNGPAFSGLAWVLTLSMVISVLMPAKTLHAEGNIGSIDSSTDYNFAKQLQLGLYFYDANMCGAGVKENSLLSVDRGGYRSNCHTSDSFSYGGKTYQAAGGYHDAGDHVKFGLPAAQAFTDLGIGYYEFQDAFTELGQKGHFQTIMDYYCDYVRSCTVMKNGKVKAFCYQIGHGQPDHTSWVSPETEDEQKTDRKYTLIADASNPATDIVSETAAALAMNYLNFGNEKDLTYAKALFSFARANEKKVGAGDDSGSFYGSSSWDDDYCLAAGLLYKATKDDLYLSEYNTCKASLADRCSQPFGWDNAYQAAVLYAPEKDTAALGKLSEYLNGYVSQSQNNYYCHDQWGSARINCNIQLIMQIVDKYQQTTVYQNWCRNQMSMILGNNPQKINLVCGYNKKSPKKPHHRAASGYNGWDGFNANATQKYTLFGALVGGPSGSDFSTYQDTVGDAVCNEVTLDYNAGMIGAAAALYLQHKNSKKSGYTNQSVLTGFYGGKDWSDPTYKAGTQTSVDPDGKGTQTGNQNGNAYGSDGQQMTVKKTTLKKAKKTGNKIKVSWKKNEGVDGYQLQIAQNKKFTKGLKTKKIKASKTSTVFKKLKKKTYYVRIRAFKKDQNGTYVYGKWSKKKRAK